MIRPRSWSKFSAGYLGEDDSFAFRTISGANEDVSANRLGTQRAIRAIPHLQLQTVRGLSV